MNMCIEACESLGAGIGQWIFIACAFAFGWWQKRQAMAAKAENTQLKASLRPPAPVPVIHYQGAPDTIPFTSLFPPRPADYAPAYESEIVGSIADTARETPSAKEPE